MGALSSIRFSIRSFIMRNLQVAYYRRPNKKRNLVVALFPAVLIARPYFEIVEEVLSELLPRYRESSSVKKAATTRSERSVAKALVGRWTGALHTWKGNFPLTLEIAASRDVQAKWDSGHWMKATDVDISEPRFYCIIHGLKGIPGAPQPPYDLELELYLRAKTLVGAGTTKDDAQLPYWIQLEKSAASLQGSVAVPSGQLQRGPSRRSACGSLIEPRKSAE